MSSLVWHDHYSGKLGLEDGTWGSAELYGFRFARAQKERSIELRQLGTYFGLVMQGGVRLTNRKIKNWTVHAGQWFSIPHEICIENADNDMDSQVVVIRQKNYIGFYAMGGPVEDQGRLRYIDGCSDSLLLCPPRLGDPCLNLLHFPAGIKQTMHNHPSVRMGAVISGSGLYVTRTEQFVLRPGSIFMIPTGVYHHFQTLESTLNVFAFHPDSDWGPEDEVHPMINRTWVNGKKIETRVPDAKQS